MTVSASTASNHRSPLMTASHARRSPGIGNGTSVRQRRLGWSSRRSRSSNRSCPASLIGSPAGNARRRTSRPTAAPRPARSASVARRVPSSVRATADRDSPHARLNVAWLSPALRLDRAISARTRDSSSSAIRRARAMAPCRAVIGPHDGLRAFAGAYLLTERALHRRKVGNTAGRPAEGAFQRHSAQDRSNPSKKAGALRRNAHRARTGRSLSAGARA
jgi:hypothetical protein